VFGAEPAGVLPGGAYTRYTQPFSSKSGSSAIPWRPSSEFAYTSSCATCVVAPVVGSVRRTMPLRAVWRTRESGSTARSIGSPVFLVSRTFS